MEGEFLDTLSAKSIGITRFCGITAALLPKALPKALPKPSHGVAFSFGANGLLSVNSKYRG
jgi:ABC-type arginine/histidine transport system permease subunit